MNDARDTERDSANTQHLKDTTHTHTHTHTHTSCLVQHANLLQPKHPDPTFLYKSSYSYKCDVRGVVSHVVMRGTPPRDQALKLVATQGGACLASKRSLGVCFAHDCCDCSCSPLVVCIYSRAFVHPCAARVDRYSRHRDSPRQIMSLMRPSTAKEGLQSIFCCCYTHTSHL